ncbi:MAG: CHASE3 domain-containing protein [Burkholderiales bacterium]|nr:CHASE3 domain-containing protein [Burkholderiales bacterium]
MTSSWRLPWQRLPDLRQPCFAFVLAALLALAVFLIGETAYRNTRSMLEGLNAQGAARSNVQLLWRRLTDAETGQRGYLLTDRKEYLQPYLDAQHDVRASLLWLNRHYRDDRALQAPMQRLEAAAQGKLAEMADTLRFHDEGAEQRWRDLVLSDQGRQQMEVVRALSEQLLAGETKRVAVARGAMSGSLTLTRAAVAGMAGLSLLLAILYLRQTAAFDKRRAEQVLSAQRERDEREAQVRGRTLQLTELAHHLQTAREYERDQLARALHDELGAVLTAAKLDVARLKSRLATPELLGRVAHLSDTLDNGISLKRRIVEDLRPSTLGNLGLVTALEVLAREWGEHNDLPVQTFLEKVALLPSAELTAYRLVQQALTNVGTHAEAGKVSVTLESVEGKVFVSVRDDGVGFDSAAPPRAGHGLLGLRYRLEAEGGELAIVSSPGAGTLIAAVLPESA